MRSLWYNTYMKILLLEDDTVLADILVDFLQESGSVTHAYSIKEAFFLSQEGRYDLYIFDINLHDGDGISLLRELRSFMDETPTIFITAFHDNKYLKNAFESGANDFIRKPFDLEELEQRINNIKRYFGIGLRVKLSDEIEFDMQTNMLRVDGKQSCLGAKEGACLAYLYKNRHRVVSSDELLQNLWAYEEMPSNDAIRTIIKELRKHLGYDHIVNIRSQGYRFE